MSDQEDREVKIFFDSNRSPWERQYTDGKGNWYDRNELNYIDESDRISFIRDNTTIMTSSLQLLNLRLLSQQYNYGGKTYNKNSLFYFKDKEKFYDPNSNEFYDTIGQSFQLYCRYDPIEPGPYDPTNPNKLHRVLSQIRRNNIEIEMKTQNNTSYKLYVFAKFDSPSSFVNC